MNRLMRKFKNSNKKAVAIVTSAVLMVAVGLVGTFAWLSISQQAKNENVLEPNPGGRIHDDFDGENKDVYAENFTNEEEGGVPVFVRIRLDEYMERGKDAGVKPTVDEEGNTVERDAIPLIEGAKIDDTSTWKTHIPNATDDPFHEFWTWKTGGSTIFMPTFNKNKDSLAVDINGTYDGLDSTDDKHYDDYVTYADGEKKTAEAYYDNDTNTVDEGNGVGLGNGGTINTNYIAVEETHTAQPTLNATVLTMEEWINKGCPVGNYWVWDEDGWAYWAKPLQPGESTGLLLDGIEQKVYMTDKNYYAINVVGQFATAGDWGEAGTEGEPGTGFYDTKEGTAPTENALKLLNQAASVKKGADGDMYVDCGANTYKKIIDEAGNLSELICAGLDEKIGNSDDKTNVIQLKEELKVTVNGVEVNFGTLFLGPDASNAYLSVGPDGRLGTADDVKIWYTGNGTFPGETGDISTVGADAVEVTATGNVKTVMPNSTQQFTATVLLGGTAISNQKVTWRLEGGNTGTKIDKNTGVLTISGSEKKDTVLTVTAISDEDKNATGSVKVKVVGPDAVEVTTAGNAEKVNVDGSLAFAAEVKLGGNNFSSQEVTWSVSGNAKSNTDISDSGVLTVAADETADSLTVKAVSKVDGSVIGTKTVKVVKVDAITVTPDSATVAVGKTQKFSATVTLNGKTAASVNQGVTWSVSGNAKSGTSIGSDGTLTIASDETAATITVKATSTVDSSVSKSVTVTVKQPVQPGADVTVDGLQWVVLATENGNSLIWCKSCVGNAQTFGSLNSWSSSSVRTWLNGTWLNNQTTLKNNAINTTIKTRSQYNSSSFTTTTDKVFLLSEADVFGTFNGGTAQADDYTYNGAQLQKAYDNRNIGQYYWLRSPRSNANGVASVYYSGNSYHNHFTGTRCVRPALWVPSSILTQ